MQSTSRFYPLNQTQPYPFEQWWIGAYSSEVNRILLSRTILGQPLILFRTEAGQAAALAGLCPHRLYPLGKGILRGDTVQCGYHGFTYDRTGLCVHVPSQDAVPAGFRARSFPVVERGGLIWVWTGQESNADPTRLPDLERLGLGRTDWAVEQHPRVTIKARYQLLIDNLLDLSHISYIHATSIPGGAALAKISSDIVETGESLCVRRVGKKLPSNPFFQMLFPDYAGPVDQHFDTEYLGPNLIRSGGAVHASAGDGSAKPTLLGTTNFLHGITPATPNSVHYFVMTARDIRVHDAGIGGVNLQMGTVIQSQDVEALEAIEINIDAHADTRRELSCAADEGAIRVRRRLAAQIRNESAHNSATSSG
jgi:phenylpropionate dioxygenase-like ring-hydroxylating dioxygenase large terminal subunit